MSAGGTSCLTRCLCHSICTRRSSSRRRSLWSGQAAQQLGNGRAFRRHQSSHGRILAHQTDAKDNGEEAQLELLAILHASSSLAQLHLASSAQSEPYALLAEQAQLAPFRVPVELLAPLETAGPAGRTPAGTAGPIGNCWSCHRDYPWRRHHWWASWRCCAQLQHRTPCRAEAGAVHHHCLPSPGPSSRLGRRLCGPWLWPSGGQRLSQSAA